MLASGKDPLAVSLTWQKTEQQRQEEVDFLYEGANATQKGGVLMPGHLPKIPFLNTCSMMIKFYMNFGGNKHSATVRQKLVSRGGVGRLRGEKRVSFRTVVTLHSWQVGNALKNTELCTFTGRIHKYEDYISITPTIGAHTYFIQVFFLKAISMSKSN